MNSILKEEIGGLLGDSILSDSFSKMRRKEKSKLSIRAKRAV